VVNENCARLTILLALERVGKGASVEGLCSLVRVLLAAQLVKKPPSSSPTKPSGLPCSGHGSCEMSDVGTFCKCHVGHTGTFCEHSE